MDFVSNKAFQIEEMLQYLGVGDFEDLLEDIPKELRLKTPLEDDGFSEFEGVQLMEELAKKNTYPNFCSYLGAGSYEHHIPALVAGICSRAEFLTAYTPYQAEASQGTLQAIFEFQSAICALTEMDVSNASVYDGASACAEAVLMCLRHFKSRRKKVLVAASVHPHYVGVLKQYLKYQDAEIVSLPFSSDGLLQQEFLDEQIDDSVAAFLIQSPNFLGVLENVQSLLPKVKEVGALSILCANPLSYGLYASAGELGFDIAVGDTQPFGVPLSFGGPYVGYMACKDKLVRQLPARIVGQTVDAEGKKGYVLTLQAREQHIRREKATSNICTSQTLAALSSLITMLWYGKQGLRELALTNFQRASYLKDRLVSLPGVEGFTHQAILNEFVIRVPKPINEVFEGFRKHLIEPGISLASFYPHLDQHLLIAVTETKSKEQLDHYLSVAQKVLA